MKKLIIIGGLSRTGKSTISKLLSSKLNISWCISTDALRSGASSLLIDQPYITLKSMSFEARASISTPGVGSKTTRTVEHYGLNMADSQLAWEVARGVINHYDLNGESLIVEGVALTPERIATLNLRNLDLKAVFLGYSELAHSKNILYHSKQDPNDWINVWLREDGADDKKLEAWTSEQAKTNSALSESANKHGFGYFDISLSDFEDYKTSIINYISN